MPRSVISFANEFPLCLLAVAVGGGGGGEPPGGGDGQAGRDRGPSGVIECFPRVAGEKGWMRPCYVVLWLVLEAAGAVASVDELRSGVRPPPV